MFLHCAKICSLSLAKTSSWRAYEHVIIRDATTRSTNVMRRSDGDRDLITAIYIPQSSSSIRLVISFRSGFQKPSLSEIICRILRISPRDGITGCLVLIIYYPFATFTNFVSFKMKIEIIRFLPIMNKSI